MFSKRLTWVAVAAVVFVLADWAYTAFDGAGDVGILRTLLRWIAGAIGVYVWIRAARCRGKEQS